MLESLSDGGKGLKKTPREIGAGGNQSRRPRFRRLSRRAEKPCGRAARVLRKRKYGAFENAYVRGGGFQTDTAAALRLGAEICRELSGAFTVLTGTAEGGDSAAITGALKGSGNVVSVAAGGLFFAAAGQRRASVQSGRKGAFAFGAHLFRSREEFFLREPKRPSGGPLRGCAGIGRGERQRRADHRALCRAGRKENIRSTLCARRGRGAAVTH